MRVGGGQVALGRDVEGDQAGDPGAEETGDGRRSVLPMAGLVAGQEVVADVVYEPGNLQLLIVGVTLGENRRTCRPWSRMSTGSPERSGVSQASSQSTSSAMSSSTDDSRSPFMPARCRSRPYGGCTHGVLHGAGRPKKPEVNRCSWLLHRAPASPRQTLEDLGEAMVMPQISEIELVGRRG